MDALAGRPDVRQCHEPAEAIRPQECSSKKQHGMDSTKIMANPTMPWPGPIFRFSLPERAIPLWGSGRPGHQPGTDPARTI
jgi:hypothetical protein